MKRVGIGKLSHVATASQNCDQVFNDLASAQAFFSNDPIGISMVAGLNNVQLTFNETMSTARGFGFDCAVLYPTPSSWTMLLPMLFRIGLIALIFLKDWGGSRHRARRLGFCSCAKGSKYR
jgi:hypothetical protein